MIRGTKCHCEIVRMALDWDLLWDVRFQMPGGRFSSFVHPTLSSVPNDALSRIPQELKLGLRK